jgi:protein TonB
VLNGKAVRLVQPSYPPIARSAHASGQVNVQITIDENGNVISAHAVSGHPLLQGAAVAAARSSKFTPTKLSGQPVKVSGVIIYNFVAQ